MGGKHRMWNFQQNKEHIKLVHQGRLAIGGSADGLLQPEQRGVDAH